MKTWMLDVMGDTPLQETNDTTLQDQFDVNTLKKYNMEIQGVLSDLKVRNSDTQDVAFVDILKSVTEQTLVESRKLEKVMSQVEFMIKSQAF